MRTVIINEVLVINLYSGRKKWLAKMPRRLAANEVGIKVKGKVNLPDWLPVIDLGEISVAEVEVMAQASMK